MSGARASGSIVVLCGLCKGHAGEWPYCCFACVPTGGRAANHPGPGFALRAQPTSDFALGDVVVDAWTGERWELCKGKRGRTLLRSLDRAFEHEEYGPDWRYLSRERAARAETWVKPEVGPEPPDHPYRRREPVVEPPRQLVLL